MDDSSDLDNGIWFQAGCSGLWYRTPGAAGSVSEVRINGTRFHPAACEAQDDEYQDVPRGAADDGAGTKSAARMQ
jgi:hypothetical protein